MGLDLWFREDVARILAAMHEAMQATSKALAGAGDEEADLYRRGFSDALQAVGVAFGVCLPGPAELDGGEKGRFTAHPCRPEMEGVSPLRMRPLRPPMPR